MHHIARYTVTIGMRDLSVLGKFLRSVCRFPKADEMRPGDSADSLGHGHGPESPPAFPEGQHHMYITVFSLRGHVIISCACYERIRVARELCN